MALDRSSKNSFSVFSLGWAYLSLSTGSHSMNSRSLVSCIFHFWIHYVLSVFLQKYCIQNWVFSVWSQVHNTVFLLWIRSVSAPFLIPLTFSLSSALLVHVQSQSPETLFVQSMLQNLWSYIQQSFIKYLFTTRCVHKSLNSYSFNRAMNWALLTYFTKRKRKVPCIEITYWR